MPFSDVKVAIRDFGARAARAGLFGISGLAVLAAVGALFVGSILGCVLMLAASAVCNPWVLAAIEDYFEIEFNSKGLLKLFFALIGVALIAVLVERATQERAQADRIAAEAAAQAASLKQAAEEKNNRNFAAHADDVLVQIAGLISSGDFNEAKSRLQFLTIADERLTPLRAAVKANDLRMHLLKTPGLPLKDRVAGLSELVTLEPGNVELSKLLSDLKSYQARTEAAAAHQRKIDDQFSSWDGSHRAVESLIKRSMTNPKSYEHVETTYEEKKGKLIVETVFRGTNGFGAVVTSTARAVVNENGQVESIQVGR